MTQQGWPVLDVITAGQRDTQYDVVYLHGFGELGADLAEFAEHTVPPGHGALLPTLRAHGDRPRPDWGYTPGDFAADVQRTFASNGRHVVVGYSFGGIVASAYAVSVGPDRVGALVVLDQAFERRPERVQSGDWAEAVYMKWQFDYRHHILAAARLGIPVLLVFGAESSVVADTEKQFWGNATEPDLRVATVPGTHRDLVRGGLNAAPVTRAFLGEVFAKGGQVER